MTGNQEAAASGATLDSGGGKSEGASVPVSDCNTVSEHLQDKLIGTVAPGLAVRQSDHARMFLCLKQYGFSDKDFFKAEQNGFNIAQMFFACLDGIRNDIFKRETLRAEFYDVFPELLNEGSVSPPEPVPIARDYLNGSRVSQNELSEILDALHKYDFSDDDLQSCWNWNLDHVAVFGKLLDGLINGWIKEESAREDFFSRFSFLLELPTPERLKSFMEQRRQDWKQYILEWHG